MNKGNEFLATEPVGKLLFRLALPTVAAQIINMLYNVVDRIYIGHMPGDGKLALTGLGVCLPLIMAVSAFAALISAGGAPRASIFMGKGDKDSAERTMGSCFSMQIAVSLLLTAVLLLWNRPLLLSFGGSADTIEPACAYMRIYALGTLFVQLTLGMNAYISAQGFTSVSMRTVLIGALCNIVLDPIFIFLFKMGVQGAALATVISQGISCAWVLSFLISEKSIIKIKSSCLKIDRKLYLPCLALGAAPFIMQSSESLIIICFNASLQKYGGDVAVGAMTILTSVMQMVVLPLQGLSQGAQPITSYNFGAGNTGRIKQTVALLIKSSLACSGTVWLLLMIWPGLFAAIFTPDAQLLSFSAAALRIYCAVLPLMGIQIACQMTFVAIGEAKNSIIVAVMRKFVLLLPLIYLMPALMEDKLMAVYAAEPVADVLAVSFTVVLFIFQFKKILKKCEAMKAEA